MKEGMWLWELKTFFFVFQTTLASFENKLKFSCFLKREKGRNNKSTRWASYKYQNKETDSRLTCGECVQ